MLAVPTLQVHKKAHYSDAFVLKALWRIEVEWLQVDITIYYKKLIFKFTPHGHRMNKIKKDWRPHKKQQQSFWDSD